MMCSLFLPSLLTLECKRGVKAIALHPLHLPSVATDDPSFRLSPMYSRVQEWASELGAFTLQRLLPR